MKMTLALSHDRTAPRRRNGFILRTAVLVAVLLISSAVCYAQNPNEKEHQPSAKPTTDQNSLTNDERAELLKLIRSLQERVEKLEAAQAATPTSAPTQTVGTNVGASTSDQPDASAVPVPEPEPKKQDSDDKNLDGKYTPNLGYKVA